MRNAHRIALIPSGMTLLVLLAAEIAVICLTLSACSGRGAVVSGPQYPRTQPLSPQSVDASVPLSTIGNAIPLPSLDGYSETITLPANNAPPGTNLSLNISTRLPAGTPASPSSFLVARPFLYFTLSSQRTVTLEGFPGLSLTLPTGFHWDGGLLHLGYYDPARGWKHIGTLTLIGSTLTFAGNHNPITLQANVKYVALPFACAVTKIFVANAGAGFSVNVYDEAGNQLTTTGTFPNLSFPWGIALNSDNHDLYVTNFNNSSVTVYDEEGNQVTTTGSFPNLGRPQGVAFDSNNHHLYAANRIAGTDGTVTAYDADGNEITTTGGFPNLHLPIGIAFDSNNNRLYVTNNRTDTVTVYDEQGTQIATTGSFPGLSGPFGIAFDSNNHHLYVVGFNLSTVGVYDEEGNPVSITGSFPNLGHPEGVAFDGNNHELYVTNFNSITVYDEQGNQITTTGSFPNLRGPIFLTAGS